MSQSLDGYPLAVNQDTLASHIVGLFLETLLFGIFVVAYSVGTWLLLRGDQPRSLRKRNVILLATNTTMLALATTHISLTLRIVIRGFAFSGTDIEEVYEYFYRGEGVAAIARFYIYVTQTLIGDGFMLYRLLIVMDKNWRYVIAPCILYLLDIVCGYFVAELNVLGFFAGSFFTNMLCTIMIMTKVLRSGGAVTQEHWTWGSLAIFNFVRYRRVVEAIVQSAAIYSVASISLVITFFISRDVGYSTCLLMFPPLIGAVFALIVIQIAQKSALDPEKPVCATGFTVETMMSTEGYP